MFRNVLQLYYFNYYWLSAKIVPRPNLQCSQVYWQPFCATNFAAVKKTGRTPIQTA